MIYLDQTSTKGLLKSTAIHTTKQRIRKLILIYNYTSQKQYEAININHP